MAICGRNVSETEIRRLDGPIGIASSNSVALALGILVAADAAIAAIRPTRPGWIACRAPRMRAVKAKLPVAAAPTASFVSPSANMQCVLAQRKSAEGDEGPTKDSRIIATTSRNRLSAGAPESRFTTTKGPTRGRASAHLFIRNQMHCHLDMAVELKYFTVVTY